MLVIATAAFIDMRGKTNVLVEITSGPMQAARAQEEIAFRLQAFDPLLAVLKDILDVTGGYVPDTSKHIWAQAQNLVAEAEAR